MNAYIDTLIVSDENGAAKILYPKTKQEAVFGLMERLGKLEALHITETEATTMENSYAGRLEVVEIGGGESEQVTTTGAQLFDGLLEQGSFDGVLNKIDSEYRVRNSVNRPVTPNKTYTISSRVAKEASIFELDSEGNFLRILSSFTSLPLTFTTSNDTGFIAFALRIDDTTAITPSMVKDVMLNKGTTALPWEPYTGGIPSPNPSYPQEIKKTAVSEIKTHGYNLFNPLADGDSTLSLYAVSEGGYKIHTKSAGTATSRMLFNMDSLIGKSVTLQFDSVKVISGSNEILARFRYVVDGNVFYSQLTANKKRVDVTFPSNTTAVRLQIFGNTDLTADTSEYEFYGLRVTYSEHSDLPWEPYTESTITLSQPIELYGIGDVQDVIEDGKVKRRLKGITLTGDEGWKLNTSGNAYYFATSDGGIKSNSLIISTHFKNGYWMTMEKDTICMGNSQSGVLGVSSQSFSSIDELKAFLLNNEVEVAYKLNEEVIEELPIVDQIALNNLQTFDGITYLEFDSEIKPTYKGKYGTSEMGGMSLESLLTARNNDMRLTALEESVVNNI